MTAVVDLWGGPLTVLVLILLAAVRWGGRSQERARGGLAGRWAEAWSRESAVLDAADRAADEDPRPFELRGGRS